MAQDSKTNYEQLFSDKKFGAFFRINQLILRPENEESNIDLFNKEHLETLYHLQVNFNLFRMKLKRNQLNLKIKAIHWKTYAINQFKVNHA